MSVAMSDCILSTLSLLISKITTLAASITKRTDKHDTGHEVQLSQLQIIIVELVLH